MLLALWFWCGDVVVERKVEVLGVVVENTEELLSSMASTFMPMICRCVQPQKSRCVLGNGVMGTCGRGFMQSGE
jgi:hypothetical protein